MSQKLAEYDERFVGGGIAPSKKNLTSRLWVDGEKIVFDADGVRPLPGTEQLFLKLQAAPIIGMIETEVAGVKTLFFGTADALYQFEEGGTVTDVSRTTGGAYNGIVDATTTQIATKWSFADWGGDVYAANGIDNIQRFQGTTFENFTPTNAPTLASIIGRVKDYLIAYGTNSNARAIQWASSNSPTTWGAAATNSAGTLAPRDMDTDIRCVRALGEGEIAIYNLNQMFRFSFVGSPAFFVCNRALTGIGAVSCQSITSVGSMHFGFGPRGIWQADGSSYDYIDVPDVREFIFEENILRSQLSKAIALHDPGQSLVLFYWPADVTGQNTQITKGVGYNYKLTNWTIFNAVRTAGTEGSVFDFPITGDNEGNVWKSSIEGFVPSVDYPMTLAATYELEAGYGALGYGSLGYGGIETGVG